MNPKKIVLDTDVILEHVTRNREMRSRRKSLMREAMLKCFCYTTVFNVIELFALCETEKQERTMEHVLGALKVLGLNGKSGKSLGSIIRRARRDEGRDLDALIGGLCLESKLPLLTGRRRSYRGIRGLRLLSSREIAKIA